MTDLMGLVMVAGLCLVWVIILYPIFAFLKSLAGRPPSNTNSMTPSQSQSSGTAATSHTHSSASTSSDEKPPSGWDKPDWLKDEEREAKEERNRENWEKSYTKKFIDFLRD